MIAVRRIWSTSSHFVTKVVGNTTTFSVAGSDTWNSLPLHIRQT